MKKTWAVLSVSILVICISCTGVVNPSFLMEKQLPGPVLTIIGYDSELEQLSVSASLPEDKVDVESGFSFNWLVDDVPVETDEDILTFQISEDQLIYPTFVTSYYKKYIFS